MQIGILYLVHLNNNLMYRHFDFDYSKIGIKSKYFQYSTKGYIKDKFEDFIVEEVSFEKEKKEGNYTYFTLIKTNWTTMRALHRIARYCHVSWKRFSFAGTKDKHGITKQLVCVKGVKPSVLEKLKIKDIKISNIFTSDKQLRLGELHGNKFIVTVKDYECKHLKEVLELFKQKIKQGVPNYFGEQRFGIQRPDNHIIGKLILKENYEEAMKELLAKSYSSEGEQSRNARDFLFENWGEWKEALTKFPKYLSVERIILNHLTKHKTDFVNAMRKLPKNIAKIFVYSYQSYIFNLSVSKMIEKNLLADFEIELPGYASTLKKLGGSVVEEILNNENMKLSDFRVSSYPEISCRGGIRRVLLFPKRFGINSIKKNQYTISFQLPKASYATMVLKELVV